MAGRPSPNWQEKYHLYTTYSPCFLGGLYAAYHLLREPETTIDNTLPKFNSKRPWKVTETQ